MAPDRMECRSQEVQDLLDEIEAQVRHNSHQPLETFNTLIAGPGLQPSSSPAAVIETPTSLETSRLTPRTKRLRAKDLWDDLEEDDENAPMHIKGRAISTTPVSEHVGKKRIRMGSPPPPKMNQRMPVRRNPQYHNRSSPRANPSTAVVKGGSNISSGQAPGTATPATFPRFNNLPDRMRDRIFTLLLQNETPIVLHTGRLSSFIRHHTPMPPWAEKLTSTSTQETYTTPIPKPTLQTHLTNLHQTMTSLPPSEWLNFLSTERSLPASTYSANMTPALLLTPNSATQTRAARIFYSTNTFHFPHPQTAWLHLEALLTTITRKNSQHIRHLRLPAPQFHAGPERDAIQGAVLDCLSPATRLAIFANRPEDRLLSALETCAKLAQSGALALESLRIDLTYPDHALRFISRHPELERLLIPLSEVERRVEREERGVRLLRVLSLSLRQGRRPVLVLRSPEKGSRVGREHLEAVVGEARRYGWGVECAR